MIIDCHYHYFPSEFNLEKKLREMDAAGIDKIALIAPICPIFKSEPMSLPMCFMRLLMGKAAFYPLLKKLIGDFMGDEVRLVDSGKVTAQAAAAALEDLGLLNGKSSGGTARYFVSDTPENFAELSSIFLGEFAGGPVERIAIETY